MKVPLFHSEADHPGVVQQYPILDTAPEQEFDDLTHLAAQICGTPFSALTLVDQDRQWFKSCFGFEAAEMPCEFSIQTHIILGQDLLIVSDTAADERYANNPLVASPPHIRFHAGLPLITHEGKAAGTLCVLDIVPRQLDPPQQDALRRLARLAVVRLEARPDAKLEDGHGRQEAEQLALTLETARLNAEILKASRERYQRLFEAAKDGILILDAASGEIEDVNPFLCELLGYSPSDFLGKQLWEIGTFRDIAANQDAFRTLQDKEYIRHDDLPLQTRDGQSVSVEFVSNVYWSNGKKVIQCNIRDITARKSTEAVAARLASIVASSDDAIISKTLDGIITTWNAGAQALYGYTAEEMIGQSISILVPSDMPNEMPQLLEKIGRGELVEHYETVRVDKDGNRKDISLSISPLRDAHGNIIGASSIKRDITQRKIAEQQLRMRSRLLNAIGQAVIVTDLAGTITYWNDSAVELYGWPASEALGQNILNVTPSNTTREQAAAILACLAHGERWSGELVVQRRDGTTFPAYVTDTPVWDAAGQAVGIIGLSLDISDRKRAELEGARLHAQIDEQRQRLNTIVATVPGLVWETWTQPDAVTGRTDFVSDYIGTMLGYSVNDWLETPNFWLTIIHPDDKERAAREVAAIYAGGRGGTTCYRWMPQDGQAVWVESRLVIVCDEAGKPLGARGVSMDISERMQAADALQKAYDQMETRVQERTADLVAATKMADSANLAKSEFLSRMSHELRTPLNAVLGFGQLLEQRELTPRSRKDVGHILSGGRHLLSLINEILDLSRVEAGHIELSVEPISLRVIISEACALMHPLAAERAIELDDSAVELESGFVLADLQRLRQVLLNLLSNAIKYNREGGRVEIFCLPRPDGRISIAMRDTGPGISPEDLPRLFTPFERLRAATSTIEGSGLGLALSRRLVVAMGGTLNVESTLGQGTTFTVELPRANSPLKPQAAISGVSHLLYTGGKNERTYLLLYIEDNPSNLQLVEAIFETRPQWRLLTATQGSIGLDLARQHKPDLILLDVNLPDIDGKEVLKRLRQSALTREIPVIAVSADATAKQVGRLTAAGAIAYLTKPLDIVQFLETVDNLLLAMPAGISQSHNNDT